MTLHLPLLLIVGITLPQMMGALGANIDQITWVVTSYIVSSAIIMPLTGLLVNRLGRKKLLLISISGFMVTSALCGFATALPEMVLFRSLQGIFGASLIPLSQIILRETFSKKEQGIAMAIWGMGIMVAPILGPTLGGYITEALNWRWIFYINIPVCLLALFMTVKFISESVIHQHKIDWLGLSLMAVGIGTFQMFLDRGNSVNWLQSGFIVTLLAVAVVSIAAFILRGIYYKNNIINLKLFADRNYAVASLLFAIFAVGVFSVLTLQPVMMQSLMGYPIETAGLLMAPRGIASIVGMLIVAKLINRVDPRWILICGIILTALGIYYMSDFAINTTESMIIYTGVIQGIGMGLFFVPLAACAYNTLPKEAVAEAAGLYSFSRNLGSSIGIALFGTMVARQTQIYWHRIGAHIIPTAESLQVWLHKQGLTIHDPVASYRLTHILSQQAGMLAFINVFWIIAVGMAVVMVPLVFLLKQSINISKSQ